ncbi:hypothetical protein RvY_12268-2 [Ramazzottius varieornatus]|uniref:C-type lectin domain-containing protein n=1 Tax=Ramazzottius varieornatus TaxID=947166 RepID=A0A1D1VPC7_RAMVA|nr:hypothetical protein RvY_12268-2 [Ramazzottius varieornatus]
MNKIQVCVFANILIAVFGADIVWNPPCPTSCTCDFERGQKRAECEFESSSFRVNMTDVDSDVLLLDILPLSRGEVDAYGPSLPDLFGQFPKLLRLSVRNNGITNIPVGTATNLTRLHYLDLSGNNIRDFIDLHLEILDDIVSLQLSGNLLDNIDGNDLKPLRNLTTLGVSGNHISRIDASAFDGLVYLSFLNLQDNNLEELAPSIFDNIPRLNFLNLKHNEFREIPRGIQKLQLLGIVFLNQNFIRTVPVELVRIWNSSPAIEAIGLDKNPLLCNFALAPFVRWAKTPSGFSVLCQVPKLTTANATENSTGCPVCIAPETMNGRDISTLTIRELSSSQANMTVLADNATLTPPAGTDFGYALLITLDFPRAPTDFSPKRNASGPFALTTLENDTMAKLSEFMPSAIVHCGTFKCYFFSVKGVREWRTAAYYCQAIGLDLVEIGNATEQNEIFQFGKSIARPLY